MSKYNLNNFGAQKFELLSQNLVQQVIGPGAKVYGMGKDGAREATFRGKAPYPSKEEIWDGDWIFQAKFHDIQQIGLKEARKILFRELNQELKTITEKYKHPCDNYILITNVSLSPVYKTGLKDKIDEIIIPEYKKNIKNIHVWGSEEICSLLDIHPNVRQRYSELLVSGDIISKLMGLVEEKNDDLDEKVKLYCQGSYLYESAAALDDAGDIDDHNIELPKIFIDLNVKLSQLVNYEIDSIPKWMKHIYKGDEKETALSYILDDTVKGLVFVGGPGLGKSTLGQYISQVYRARLIGKLTEFEPDNPSLESVIPRIPFRVILKDFAWWLSEQENTTNRSLFHFLSYELSTVANIEITVNDIHRIIKDNPIMLILDGLDEVPEKELRQEVLDQINIFINQIANVYTSDYRIIASTRPQGYTNEFDPTQYLHLNLEELNKDLAIDYATRWVNEKEKNPKDISKILTILKMCLNDKIVKDLTKTPLQITILLVIIRAGSTPPKQREELYQTYMDTIYSREQKKSLNLITTDKSVIYGLHQYLGYLLHKRAEKKGTDALMTIQEFREHVLEFLVFLDPIIDEEQLAVDAHRIITEARDRLILIESPQDNKVGFNLTVLREFFASCHLVETSKDSNERNKRFKAIAKSPYWRNVALFFAGRVGRTLKGEASNLIDICREVDNEDENQFLKRGSQLALEIVKDKALRVPYNELSALEYSLSILESDVLSSPQDIITVLKENIDNKSFSKLIERWLLDKIDNVKPEKVKKYLEVYYEVFGLKDKIINELKRLALNDSLEIAVWEFELILNNGITDEWIIPVVEKILHDKSIYFLLTNDSKWENTVDLFQLDFNTSTKGKLCRLLYESLIEIDFNNKDEYVLFQKVKEKIVLENKHLKDDRYLLPWGVCFAIISSQNELTNDRRVSLPYIAYKSFKECISEARELLSKYVLAYKEVNDKFINLMIDLFNFYLNPNNPAYFLSFINNEDNNMLAEVRTSLFVNLSNKHKDVAITLYNLYKSGIDLERDLDELNQILDDVHSDYFKYGFWIEYNGNPFLEKLLNQQVVSGIKEWLFERGLSYSVINANKWYRTIDFKEMALIEFELLKERAFRNPESNRPSSFVFHYLSDLNDGEGSLDQNTKEMKNELLNIMQHLLGTRPKDSFTLEILWLLLNIGEATEEHFKLLCNKVEINNIEIEFFSPSVSHEVVAKNLIGFIDNPDENISLLAGRLLSTLPSRLYSYNRRTDFNLDMPSKYMKMILNNKENIKRELLKGLEIFNLDWKEIKEHFLDDIFSSDKEVQKIWINVIQFSGHVDDNSKKELRELLSSILENETKKKHLYRAAMIRLERETINSRFDEGSLNLPLPRRNIFSF